MKPVALLLLVSLVHPAVSSALFAFDVFDSLIGAKGAPVGIIYDVLSLGFLILNLPGVLLSVWWWDTALFHAPGWRVAFCFAVILVSWACWTAIFYGLMRAARPSLLRRINCTQSPPSNSNSLPSQSP